MFEGIVIVLAIVFYRYRRSEITEFDYYLRIVIVDRDWRNVLDYGFYFIEYVCDQKRVISGEKTSLFLNECGMANVLMVEHLVTGVDDVVGNFLSSVICG